MLGLQGKLLSCSELLAKILIAWAICQQLAEAGVDLFLGYQKRFMSRVFQLKDKLPAIKGFYPLDVAQDETTQEFFEEFKKDHPGRKIDVLVHAIGFAPRAVALTGSSCLLKMQTSIRQ